MNDTSSKINSEEYISEALYDDPKKMLEFTQKLLEKQLYLTKVTEEKCEALKKKNIKLECQNDVIKAKIDLLGKDSISKEKNNKITKADFIMEEDMLKAQLDTSILKAIVNPLENEIETLQKRLTEAETRLCVSYNREITTFPEVTIDESSTTDLCDSDDLQDENLVAERMELEMASSAFGKKLSQSEVYVVALARQKDHCEKKIKMLEAELSEVKDVLKDEKIKSSELQQTWEKANEEYLLSSLNFRAEIKRLGENEFTKTHQRKVSMNVIEA